MGGFELDVKRAIENLEHGVVVDFTSGNLTAFALVCINEDGASSHGGQIGLVPNGRLTPEVVEKAINETIAAALDVNQATAEDPNHTCKYVPVTIGIAPEQVMELGRQLTGAPVTDRDWMTMPDEDGIGFTPDGDVGFTQEGDDGLD